MISREPLISILTPVYNGEKYLAACIESVLAQTYQHWEYTIVNNCSTDRSLEIAQSYAMKVPRIRVYTNEHFVGAIENHNIAMQFLSPRSRYCKMVSADDWLYPECIKQMVQLAEQNPSVAIVGCYGISAGGIHYLGLPPEETIFRGGDICRSHLLGGPLVMPAPTCALYSSEIVRSQQPFFPGPELNADIAACYRSLQGHEFGFVHQILSFIRVHDASLTCEKIRQGGLFLDRIDFLQRFGRIYLQRAEFDTQLEKLVRDYYLLILAPAVINRYPKTFWAYHETRIGQMGLHFSRSALLKGVICKLMDLLGNPKSTMQKVVRRCVARRRSEAHASSALPPGKQLM